MSDGGGQLKVFTLGSDFAYAKMYHYTGSGGSTTLKNIFEDEALQVTLDQPLVADIYGTFKFYALGDYRLVVDTAADINAHDWDEIRISRGQSFILDYGTALPAATAANKGQMRPTIDGNGILRDVSVNQNTSWRSIFAANAAGNKTDDAIVLKNYPYYDVTHTDWGAVAGAASDQTSSIQAAIDAIATAGGGTLFIPEGIFQVDGSLDINNTNVTIIGQGIGKSILVQTADAAAPMIDYDTTDPTNVFEIRNISLHTSFAGAGAAIDAAWSSVTGTITTCIMKDVEILNTAATITSAYFTKGIALSNAGVAQLDNVNFRGKENDIVGMTHFVDISGTCHRLTMRDCNGWYAQYAVGMAGTASAVNIVENTFDYVDYGINANFSVLQERHILANNNIQAFTSGIRAAYLANSSIRGNNITKYSTSTEDFIGINALVTSDTLKIIDNEVREAGASGTDTGILVSCNDCNVENNTIEDQDTGISADATSNTNNFKGNMAINNTANYADAGTDNGWDDYGFETPTITIASATTITLPAVGKVFNMTGSTAVTTINGGWDGRIAVFTITTPDAVTFTNTTGNLEMNANFPLGDKDTLTFVYTNSKWRRISEAANV